MPGRKVGLVHPPLDAFVSGGNVYNAKLLDYARPWGSRLVSLPWGAAPDGAWDLLLWDSLLMEQVVRRRDERVGLLLHYLPSLDPGLAPAARTIARDVEDRAMSRADFAIATGHLIADTVAARGHALKVAICEPGTSACFPAQVSRQPNAAVTLLTVANLLPAKGHVQVLNALTKLSALPWHWHLAGDCSVSPETAAVLRERAASLGLGERLTWHGAVSQQRVAELMAHSDVLVCASSFEAYGMTIAEAVASVLPVLSTRVGAASHLIRHGSTGFLADPGDQRRFAGYLERLIRDTGLRATFRDHLRVAHVRRWEHACAEFDVICEGVLQ